MLAEVTDGADAELVAAGWLHDTVEDTGTTREELAQKFGERVAALVVRGDRRHVTFQSGAPAKTD